MRRASVWGGGGGNLDGCPLAIFMMGDKMGVGGVGPILWGLQVGMDRQLLWGLWELDDGPMAILIYQ